MALSASMSIIVAGILALYGYPPLASPCSFSNLREGQKLKENAVVFVHARGSISIVKLMIDGRDVSTKYLDSYGNNRSVMFGLTLKFDIPTCLFRNGLHTMEIKAGSKIYDRRRVIFDNATHIYEEGVCYASAPTQH